MKVYIKVTNASLKLEDKSYEIGFRQAQIRDNPNVLVAFLRLIARLCMRPNVLVIETVYNLLRNYLK